MKIRIFTIVCIIGLLSLAVFSQTMLPEPGTAKSIKIPQVQESTLKNGLKVAVVQRSNVPLVSVTLLVKAGAEYEDFETAGLSDMTAALLTKGTKKRTATQIAEQIEFLGGTLETGADWNSATISINVMSDKLDQALAIMADAALYPAFKPNEIELYRSQTIDGLSYNLTQPGFLANYVASVYSFDEHPIGGTPDSIKSIKRNALVNFHRELYAPKNSVLIFSGDISSTDAKRLAEQYFGKWKDSNKNLRREIITKIFDAPSSPPTLNSTEPEREPVLAKIVVIDLPDSGQAAVSYSTTSNRGRLLSETSDDDRSIYYSAIVMNSLLGGGYSSRLNQEIRIKRGLSYGAGSGFAWRAFSSNFGTRTQTKNESAAEVAELVITELNRLIEGDIPETELNPRRLSLIGNFSMDLETNTGLADAIADLYSFDLPVEALNSYMENVRGISAAKIKGFSADTFAFGNIIIVGDYSKFGGDLAKRFPNTKIDVVKADELDITKVNLRK